LACEESSHQQKDSNYLPYQPKKKVLTPEWEGRSGNESRRKRSETEKKEKKEYGKSLTSKT